MKTVYLLGNPNVGKTSLFNALTGKKERVGNWPGITLERIEGYFEGPNQSGQNTSEQYKQDTIKVIDLPGIYSLMPITPEETLVRNLINEISEGIVVNVVDASNLERNLFLTLQLIEIGINFILVLNCYDELKKIGAKIDINKMEILLQRPVIATAASIGEGIDQLKQVIWKFSQEENNKNKSLNISDKDIDKIVHSYNFETNLTEFSLSSSWIKAVKKILENENKKLENIKPFDILASIEKLVLYSNRKQDNLNNIRNELIQQILLQNQSELYQKYAETSELLRILPCKLAEERYKKVQKIISECLITRKLESNKLIENTNKLDMIFLHRIWGIPIFITIMTFIFWLTFVIGSLPSEYIRETFTIVSNFLKSYLPSGLLSELITDGVLSGLSGVFIFLPNIIILYVFLVILEDSGYLARVAFLTDFVMQKMGLHGRAFVPFLMSYGCNVPAVIATRIIENTWQRKLAMFLVPMVFCSARLPVMVLMVSAFFPHQPALILSLIYILNLVVVFFIGKLASKVIKVEKSSIFLLEMPPYRFPTLTNLYSILIERVKHFLEKAGTIIILGSIIIWVLNTFPRNPTLSKDYDKEIQNLNIIYANNQDKLVEMKAYLLKEKEAEIYEKRLIGKIGKILFMIVKPIGITWREAVSLVPGVLAKESIISTLTILYSPVDEDLGKAMQKNGIKKSSAFSFIVLSLFYIPCLSTLGILYKESNSLYIPIITVLLSFTISWILSFILYQGFEIYNLFLEKKTFDISIFETLDLLLVISIFLCSIYFITVWLIDEIKGNRCTQCKFKKANSCNKENGGSCEQNER